jgi:hypothetical protein
MRTQKFTNKFGRLVLLVFTSTVIAEVLSGSTTLSRIQNLPVQFLLYGSAAVLIREVSLRLDAKWPTILLFGLAFGLTLEGLVLQSVFNPVFLTNNLAFGRSYGINWVWAAYMPPFHAFFSICTPILLCEVVFGDVEPQPWASNAMTWIAAILLLLLLIAFHFLFIKIVHFNTSLPHLLILFVVIVLIVFIALKVRDINFLPQPVTVSGPSYSFWVITAVSLAAVCLWYLGFATIFIPNKPAPWIPLLAAPVIAGAYFVLLTCWSVIKIHTVKDRLALVCGLLTGETIFGYFATLQNPADHYAQLGLMFMVVLMLIFLYIRVSKRAVANKLG